MPEVWCWYKNGYGWNRSSWSAVRVDAGKHVDFCRGSVLSTAERSRVTYFTTDKAYERACSFLPRVRSVYLLKGVELLILRPTRHTSALLFHRVVSVSDGKITECFYDTRILRA